jgi:hypothetical protein
LPGRFLLSTIIIVSLYSFPTPAWTLCTSLFRAWTRYSSHRLVMY